MPKGMNWHEFSDFTLKCLIEEESDKMKEGVNENKLDLLRGYNNIA